MAPDAVNCLLISSSRCSWPVDSRLIHLWNQGCEISEGRRVIACGMPCSRATGVPVSDHDTHRARTQLRIEPVSLDSHDLTVTRFRSPRYEGSTVVPSPVLVGMYSAVLTDSFRAGALAVGGSVSVDRPDAGAGGFLFVLYIGVPR